MRDLQSTFVIAMVLSILLLTVHLALSPTAVANATVYDECPQHTSCQACTAAPTGHCGWCDGTNRCTGGVTSGPNDGSCMRSGGFWAWFPGQCVDAPTGPKHQVPPITPRKGEAKLVE